MTRNELALHIKNYYKIEYDCPFEDEFDAWVFRHPDNKKWFALIMRIKKCKLGFNSDEYIDIVNLKCAPEIMDDLYLESGVFPAYHMNKKHWLTLCLDGSCDDKTLKWVTKISYDLTKKKIKKAKKVLD